MDDAERSTVAADEFEGGDGMCDGDSGSGAFDQTQFDAGRWFAFGVFSRGDQSTCTGSIYTRSRPVEAAAGRRAAAEAAQLGGYSVPAWAVDASSDGGAASGARPRNAERRRAVAAWLAWRRSPSVAVAAGILGALALVTSGAAEEL